MISSLMICMRHSPCRIDAAFFMIADDAGDKDDDQDDGIDDDKDEGEDDDVENDDDQDDDDDLENFYRN